MMILDVEDFVSNHGFNQLHDRAGEIDGFVVYLIHFLRPYHHARHYMGSTDNLPRRLDQHMKGRKAGGARLMEVVYLENGIPFVVARLWPGGRDLEKQLKQRHDAPRLCPICRGQQLQVAPALQLAQQPQLLKAA